MKYRKPIGIARFSFTGMLTLCCVITLSQQGCSSVSESPDPAAVRAAIAEAGEQEQQLIRSTIDDPERLESFIALVDQRDTTLRNHVAEIEQYRADFEVLNADYHATREDLDNLVARYNQQRETAQQDLVQLLGAMKRSTTQEEWRVIWNFQKKKLHPRDLAYGGGLTKED